MSCSAHGALAGLVWSLQNLSIEHSSGGDTLIEPCWLRYSLHYKNRPASVHWAWPVASRGSLREHAEQHHHCCRLPDWNFVRVALDIPSYLADVRKCGRYKLLDAAKSLEDRFAELGRLHTALMVDICMPRWCGIREVAAAVVPMWLAVALDLQLAMSILPPLEVVHANASLNIYDLRCREHQESLQARRQAKHQVSPDVHTRKVMLRREHRWPNATQKVASIAAAIPPFNASLMLDKKIVFLGITQDDADHLDGVRKYIEATAAYFKDWAAIFVENDSRDHTFAHLLSWAREAKGRVHLISGTFSTLKRSYEHGHLVMVGARNSYLEALVSPWYASYEYALVVDMGMSNGWSPTHLTSVVRQALQTHDFAAVCANGIWTESGRMWDTFPYRTEQFNIAVDERCENPYRHYEHYQREGGYLDLLMVRHVGVQWKSVWSCFGGAALYLRKHLVRCRHASPSNDDEHVAMHACLRANGGGIYLDPSWVIKYKHYQTEEPRGPLYATEHMETIMQDFGWCNCSDAPPGLEQCSGESASKVSNSHTSRAPSREHISGEHIPACYAGSFCSLASVTPDHSQRLRPAFLTAFFKRPRIGLNIVHIGCNALNSTQYTNDLYQLLLVEHDANHRMVLLEANSAVLPILHENLRVHLRVNFSNVKIVQAALCEDDHTELNFHTIDNQILSDFPWLSELAIRLHFPLHTVTRSGHFQALLDDMKAYSAGWKVSVPWRKYLRNFSVPCVTPYNLLGNAKMLVDVVDLLIVDTPSAASVVNSFLMLDGFAPKAIRLHGALWFVPDQDYLENMFLPTINSLTRRGYNLHKHFEFLWALRHD